MYINSDLSATNKYQLILSANNISVKLQVELLPLHGVKKLYYKLLFSMETPKYWPLPIRYAWIMAAAAKDQIASLHWYRNDFAESAAVCEICRKKPAQTFEQIKSAVKVSTVCVFRFEYPSFNTSCLIFSSLAHLARVTGERFTVELCFVLTHISLDDAWCNTDIFNILFTPFI